MCTCVLVAVSVPTAEWICLNGWRIHGTSVVFCRPVMASLRHCADGSVIRKIRALYCPLQPTFPDSCSLEAGRPGIELQKNQSVMVFRPSTVQDGASVPEGGRIAALAGFRSRDGGWTGKGKWYWVRAMVCSLSRTSRSREHRSLGLVQRQLVLVIRWVRRVARGSDDHG